MQRLVSVLGAAITVSVCGGLLRRGVKRARRAKPVTSIEDSGKLIEVTCNPDKAAEAAPRVTSIHVAGFSELGFFPPLLLAFRELRVLRLPGASLLHIPYGLPTLHKLEELDLSANSLLCVPYELGGLVTLKSLNLSKNKIRVMPSTLGRLTGLTALNLMGNQLEQLPQEIGNLTNLRILGLKSNLLTSLPQSFTHLVSLVELFITDNRLATLPDGFGALTSLVKMQASFNRLQRLPEDLVHAPNLELLRVAVCQLDQLPVQLTQLPSQLIHDEEVSGDTGSLVRNEADCSGAEGSQGHSQKAEDPNVFPKLAWFSLGGNGACAPLPSPRPGLQTLSAGDLEMGAKLGDGASGEVYKASLRSPPGSAAGTMDVAVKVFRSDVSPDGRTTEELAISCALDHPHITRVLGLVPGTACHPPAQQPLLVMGMVSGEPMAAKPTSKHLLRCRWAEGTTFKPALVLKVAKDIASALGYLHSLNICHGDVYAHNILLDRHTGHATLCDFGAAFAYPSFHWFWERMEVRAYGLFLHDLVQRMEALPREHAPNVQRLQELVKACTEAPPRMRLSFSSLGLELEQLEGLLSS